VIQQAGALAAIARKTITPLLLNPDGNGDAPATKPAPAKAPAPAAKPVAKQPDAPKAPDAPQG